MIERLRAEALARGADSKLRRVGRFEGHFSMVPKGLGKVGNNGLKFQELALLLVLMDHDYIINIVDEAGNFMLDESGYKVRGRKEYVLLGVETMAKYLGRGLTATRSVLKSLHNKGLITREALELEKTRSQVTHIHYKAIESLTKDAPLEKSNPSEIQPLEKPKGNPSKNRGLNNSNLNNKNSSTAYESETRDSLQNHLNSFKNTGTKSLDNLQAPPKSKKPKKTKKKDKPEDNVLAYFKSKYKQKYGEPYVLNNYGRAGTLINKFKSRYPDDKGVEVIDALFKNYELAKLNKEGYERVGLTALSQDWMIAKVMNIAYNKVEDKVAEPKVEKLVRTKGSFPSFTPDSIDSKYKNQMNKLVRSRKLWVKAKQGYIDPKIFKLLDTDEEAAKQYLLEVVS